MNFSLQHFPIANQYLNYDSIFTCSGWAYDLKTTSDDVIIKRALRTGDGLPYKYSKLLNGTNPIYEKLLRQR